MLLKSIECGIWLSLLVGCGGGEDDVSHRGGKVAGPGDIETWMGDGTQGHDGDGNTPEATRLNTPMELSFGPGGTAYVVDWNNHAIRYLPSGGVVETLVGSRSDELPGDWPCEVPDDPSACEVPLSELAPTDLVRQNHPMDVAILPDGTVAIAAWHNHKIERCIVEDDRVGVVAGRMIPGFSGDDGPAAEAQLNFPDSLVVDADGALLVSDQRSNRIRRIDLTGDGTITTVAGAEQMPAYAGDGGPATEAILALAPYDLAGGADNPPPGGGLALGADGTLFIADTFNHCIRKVAPGSDGVLGEGDPAEETIEAVAGTCGRNESGYAGDDGPAVEARLHRPHDVDFGPDGLLYVADTINHAIRALDLEAGTIRAIAGTGEEGYAGDGDPPLEAQLSSPYGVAFDAEGVLYIVDTGNHRIRRILP